MLDSSWYARFGEVVRLLDPYAGAGADNEPQPTTRRGWPSAALLGYLRQVASTPSSAAIAERTLREIAQQVRSVLGIADPAVAAAVESLPWPRGGPDPEWLGTAADLLEGAVDSGFPPPSVPVTRWQRNQRFPDLAHLVGGYSVGSMLTATASARCWRRRGRTMPARRRR